MTFTQILLISIKESLQVTFTVDEKWWGWENNIYKLNPIYFSPTESTENFWLWYILKLKWIYNVLEYNSSVIE